MTNSLDIIVGVVAALASIAAAYISFVQASRAAKLKSETDVLLDERRREDQRRQKAFDLATSESHPLLAALQQTWGDVQTVREIIQRVRSTAHYDRSVVLEQLTAALSSISSTYGRTGALLPRDLAATVHSVKNAASLVKVLVDESTSSPPPSHVDARLADIRSQLSDYQTLLHHGTENLRAQHVQRILAAM